MNKILLTVIFLFSFGMTALAQPVPGGGNCDEAAPICTDYSYDFPLQTGTQSQSGPSYGCLNTTPNPVWYFLQIGVAGNIEMSLTAGQDIDFIIWGPFADVTCADGDLNGANIVDCSYSSTSNETPSIPNGQVGEVYMILITNFANTQQNFSLTQTGGTGASNCNIVSCLADAGDLSFTPDVAACENDPALNVNITPFYTGNSPDPAEYSYTYILTDAAGVILSYIDPPDLTSMAPGEYNLCGFSYLTTDASLIPAPNGVLTSSDLASLLFSVNAPFCGDVSSHCVNVNIGEEPAPVLIDSTICDGDAVLFNGQVLTNSGQFVANLVTAAGCDSMVTLNLTVLPPFDSSATETMCNGDFVTYNFVDYYAPGLYTINTTSTTGCDSTIYLDITVLYSYVDIDVIGVLDCSNNSILLDGSNSAQAGTITYQWYLDGVLIVGANSITYPATVAGTYTLELVNSYLGVICSDTEDVVITSNVSNISIVGDSYDALDCNNPIMVLPITATTNTNNFDIAWIASNGGNIVGADDIEDISVDQAGTYTMIFTNLDNGCSISEEFIVSGDFSLPNVNGNATDINCITDASLTGNTNGSGTPLWTGPGVANPNVWYTTANVAGDYVLTVTGMNGCTDDETFTVESFLTEPNASAGLDQELDCLVTSTTLDGTGTSNDANNSFTWSGGDITGGNQNDVSPNVGQAGTYILTVTNTLSNCTDTDTVEVVLDVVLPIVNLNDDPLITCVINDVELSSVGSDSGSNFEYTWSGTGVATGDEYNENIEVETPGVYTLTILNTDNNCSTTEQIEVLIDQNLPVADAGADVIINCANPSIDLDGSNSSSGMNYTWVGQGIDGDSNLDPTINNPGVYYLTVLDESNGCVSIDSVISVSMDNIPEALVDDIGLLTCSNQNINLIAENINANYEYSWELPDNTIVQGNSLPTTVPGEYTLNVVDPTNGCPNSYTFDVNQNILQPTVSPNVNTGLTCITTEVELTAGNTLGLDLAYTWTGDDITTSNENLENPGIGLPGNYNLVIVDNNNGCTNNYVIPVVQNIVDPTTLAGAPINLTCSVTSSLATLVNPTTNTDMTYVWTLDGEELEDQNGPNQMFESEGSYTLVVTDESNGCSVTSSLVVVENMDSPTATGDGATLNCEISEVQLQAQSNTQFAQFEWMSPSNEVINGANPMVGEPGEYQLTVTGLNGCINDDISVMVGTDYIEPNAQSFGGEINCTTNSIELSGSSTTQNVTYEWGQGSNVLSNESTYVASTSGFYTLTVTGENGCTKDFQVEITDDFDEPQFELVENGQIDCISEESAVNYSLQTNGNYVYTWGGQNGTYQEIQNGQSIVVTSPGEYSLIIEDEGNGCQDLKTIIIEDKSDEPTAELGVVDITCFGENNGAVTIQEVTGGQAPYTYGLNGGTMTQNPINVGLTAGEYDYQIEDANGCTWETTFEVVEPIQNEIEIVPNEGVINLGDSTLLTLQVNNTAVIDSVIWEGEISSYISDFTVVVKPTHSTNYQATLIDERGCQTEAFFYLELNADREIFVPYGFSPNNDGVNDFVFIQGGNQIENISKFLIVDRWGEIVFENYDFNPNNPQEGWDGYLNGTAMNPGVFLYVAEVEFIDGKSKAFKGDVTLLK